MSTTIDLFTNGDWHSGSEGQELPFWNPATGEEIGRVAVASRADLDRALAGAATGFETWRKVSAMERCRILRKAAENLRGNAATVAAELTAEQGKTAAESQGEVASGADLIEWFAEEGRRSYGRVIPARAPGVFQFVVKQPVGPVAAFSPWNFPIAQAVRKIAAALAAGCSIIIKGPEETPACIASLVKAFETAGLPSGALNLVFGVPADISNYLIPHRIIRKVSFTGSTIVGKQLASLAGAHMKRTTMELGGHSATIVMPDANLENAASRLAAFKFRNGGQVCASPTRLLVHESVYDRFVDDFTGRAAAIRVGDGADPASQMGPLANPRRVAAMEGFVADAIDRGGQIRTGGQRIGNRGNFFAPTILTDVPLDARINNEEPFGPVAIIRPYRELEEAVTEANRLEYGLAAYAYTRSAENAAAVADAFESGMVSINHHGLALPETPFGGVKESGYGSEGGTEALEAYMVGKFVTQAPA